MTVAVTETINFRPLKTPEAPDMAVVKAPAPAVVVVDDAGLVDDKAPTDVVSDATDVIALCRDTVDSRLPVCVEQSSVNVQISQTITKCIVYGDLICIYMYDTRRE